MIKRGEEAPLLPRTGRELENGGSGQRSPGLLVYLALLLLTGISAPPVDMIHEAFPCTSPWPGVGNTLFYKKMSVAYVRSPLFLCSYPNAPIIYVPPIWLNCPFFVSQVNYPFFVSQFTTLMYLPIFTGIVVYEVLKLEHPAHTTHQTHKSAHKHTYED
jgi:hypothetical protein